MDTSILLLFELLFILFHEVIALPSNPLLDPSPLLLNSSIGNANRGITCFRQLPGLPPPAHDDCVAVIDQILSSPDVMTSKTWSVRATHPIAAEWRSATCILEIGVWIGSAQTNTVRENIFSMFSAQTNTVREDAFSMFSFVGKAQAIIQECVVGRKRAGGRSVIGPKKTFQVMVRHTMEASFA